jgi:hypothetical protein
MNSSIVTRTNAAQRKARIVVDFSTTDYVISYGHAPRGRGSWAFSKRRNPDMNCQRDAESIFWTPGSTTYGEAKKLATEHFRSKVGADDGIRYVTVFVLT